MRGTNTARYTMILTVAVIAYTIMLWIVFGVYRHEVDSLLREIVTPLHTFHPIME